MADRVAEALKQAKEFHDNDRRDTAQKLMDYYRGLYDETTGGTTGMGYFKALLKDRYPAKYDKMYPFRSYVNITRKITDARSMVFKEEVQFSIADDDEDGTNTAWLYDNLIPDEAQQLLKTCDSYKTLLGTTLIRANWRYDKIAWDLITPNVTIVVQDDLDPTRAIAIISELSWKDTAGKETRLFKVWTEDQYWEEDQDGNYIIEPQPNPYGELPFTVVRDELALDRFWLDLDTGLLNAQDTANFLKTSIQYLSAYCMPTVVVKNWNEATNPPVGPSEVLAFSQLDPQADIGLDYTDPPMHIDTVRAELDAHVAESFRSYGINPPRDTGVAASGIALKLENYDALERREDQVEVWRTALRDLLRLSIVVWNAHNTTKQAPFDVDDIQIDFGEITFPQSRKEKLEQYKMELDLGISSPSRVLMKENPDIDAETARQQVADNLAETKSSKSAGLLASILGNNNQGGGDVGA